MRRTTVPCALVLLTLALAGPARATSGTMVITSDTTLTENHDGNIVIDADDVTLDCAGFTVTGTVEERGISIDGHNGVTVENCLVTGFFHGIVAINGSSNTLRGNSTFANEGSGIVVGDTDTKVIANHADDNADWGFQAGVVGGNTYRGNEASGNRGGFAWDYGSSDRVIGNVARGNDDFGFGMNHSSHMELRGNTARGNGGAGFGVWHSDRNVVTDNTSLRNGDEGFTLGRADRNVITDNTALRNGTGGFSLVASSDHNILRNNRANLNHQADAIEGPGFEATRSDGNLFKQNRAMGNDDGFVLWVHSNNNTFVRNVACRNEDWDAYDNRTGVGNVWRANRFCRDNL